MYHVYDRHTAELPAALEHTINTCAENHPEMHFYALIDSAFAPEEVTLLRVNSAPGKSLALYADTPLQGLDELSPILLQLPQDKAERQAATEKWLAMCNGIPMLSFVFSALDLSSLKQHFSAFLRLSDDENQTYTLRFCDTCMIADILECLHPQQKQAWLNGMSAWWIIARDGRLKNLGGVETVPVAAKPNASFDQRISDAQLIRLHDKTEADRHLSNLHELMSSKMSRHLPSALYRKTRELLEQLDKQDIRDDKQRLNRVIALLNVTDDVL